jgi:drug/metabolite transporter (DMT)-like permease
LQGIALGLAAMAVMAVSIVVMKPWLSDVPVLWATLLRTAGGLLLLAVVFGAHRRRPELILEICNPKNWMLMASSSVFGGYLAYTAWMGGMKYTSASIAAALNQMSTVFIFVLGIILLKERATGKRFLALGLAVTGVWLITFG